MLTHQFIAEMIHRNIKPGDVQTDIELTAQHVACHVMVKHEARVTELLQHNNELLERARAAERRNRELLEALSASIKASAALVDGRATQ